MFDISIRLYNFPDHTASTSPVPKHTDLRKYHKVILFRQYLTTLYSLFSQNIDSTRKIPIVRLSLLDKVGGSFKVGYNRIYVILVQKSSYLFVQYAPFSEGLGFAL